MSREHEPSRLVEGEDPLEGALRRALRRAGEDAPSAAQLDALVEATLSSLGTAGGAGAAGATGSAVKWALLKSGWVKLAVVVGLLGGGGAWLAAERTGGPTATPSEGVPVPPRLRRPVEPASPGLRATPGADPGAHESGTRAPPRVQTTQRLTPVVEPLGSSEATSQAEVAEPRGEQSEPFAEDGTRGSPSLAQPTGTALERTGEARPSRGRSTPRRATPSSPRSRASSSPSGGGDRSERDSTEEIAEETAATSPPADPSDEVALLSRAQTTLAVQPGMALALLTLHRRTQPASHLAQERDAMELEALVRLQRYDALRERGRAFLQRYPDSPHGERVRELLEEAAAEAR